MAKFEPMSDEVRQIIEDVVFAIADCLEGGGKMQAIYLPADEFAALAERSTIWLCSRTGMLIAGVPVYPKPPYHLDTCPPIDENQRSYTGGRD